MCRFALAALVAFFALAGTAQADGQYAATSTPFTAKQLETYVLAADYWEQRGKAVTCGRWPHLEVVADGSLGTNHGYGGNCRIQIVASVAGGDYQRFCSLLVHEVGHEVGLPHQSNPADVMHAIYPLIPECEPASAFNRLTAIRERWAAEVERQEFRCGDRWLRVLGLRHEHRIKPLRRAKKRLRACVRRVKTIARRYRSLGWRA